ncbi:GNAT family N-acetyltransferase [Mobilitalea sibirica]|uniref:GNAT family N-acetyltransferase n=1 Tax=Mobilitalea sibirica TaxID=1462919 RepID=A0A8J7KVX4_9FIRM|nr:GNAT family N-acetyltransferase [Mobilitalea sibirica]MBH1939657.1 GNAT family N-acetyltransferase [Mobilitalea sibirica]
MFRDYYAKYLGIDKGVLIDDSMVYISDMRNVPLNKRYIYRMIITDFEGNRVLSISPKISDSMIYDICHRIKDKSIDDILTKQLLYNTGLRISKMYRMITDNPKTIIEGTDSLDRKITCEYLNDYKKFIIKDNDKILCYCKVSNIDFNYGNIVVWTDELYRRRGYARELLLKVITMCKSEGIEPLYLVDSQNTASIELAKSIGFKIIQTEIVACEVLR